MEHGNQGAGGNAGNTPNLNPAAKIVAGKSQKPGTFRAKVRAAEATAGGGNSPAPHGRTRPAEAAIVAALVAGPKKGWPLLEAERSQAVAMGPSWREPEPVPTATSKVEKKAAPVVERAIAATTGLVADAVKPESAPAAAVVEETLLAEPVVVEEEADPALVAEVEALRVEIATAEQEQIEAAERLGRPVCERVKRGRTRAEWAEAFSDDVGYFSRAFANEEPFPGSGTTCRRHTDCGNHRLSHGVVRAADSAQYVVMTVCQSGNEAFKEAEKSRNEPLKKKHWAKFFRPQVQADTVASKLEEAEAHAMEYSVRAERWSEGRRAGRGKTEKDQTTVRRSKSRGGDVDMGRPSGSVAWDPAWNEPCRVEECAYLREYVLRQHARNIKDRVGKLGSIGPSGVKFHDFLAAFSEKRAKAERKAEVVARRQALAAGKLQKMDRQTPAAQVILLRQKNEKFRRMALRQWQIRRGEKVTVQVTLATVAQHKPSERRKLTRAQKTGRPTKRGRYVMYNRRPHTPSREVQVGFTIHNASTVRDQLLKGMGQHMTSLVSVRGVEVAGKKEGGKNGKKG